MRSWIFIFLFLFAEASGVNLIPQEINEKINGLILAHKLYVRDEFGGLCEGSGSGRFDDLESIGIDYRFYKQVNVIEARRVFVECQESLLDLFRPDIAVRLYLHEYPISPRKMMCHLNFRSRVKKNRVKGQVDMVEFLRGDLVYSIYFSERESPPYFETVHVEPYEEALRIVREERNTES